MVMSNDNFQADVVFLIEATAHISPYVESLKTNYIVPTLEYFSGGSFSDDRDFGGDANPNSTLYGIVSFMSNDCRPDSASVCYAPTSNSGTFLQWLDKIQFIGGAGSTSSHIVEGLSTAINLLDDFQTFREKSSDTLNRTLKSSKHCILICNSTPYFEPVVENPIYCGYSIDQLMKVMNEKNINFSIFSPRKIQFLYKLFENAGGSLPNALTKNYAKDRRHLVLLNGFHLQEKPMSPSSQPPSTEHTGLKRPLSPTSNSQPMLPNPQMRNSQLSSLIANESAGTPFGQHPKLAGDMGSIQPRGGSPWPANGSVPSPSQGPRNPNMTPVRARATTPQMASANLQSMNPAPSPGQLPNLVPQASPASKPVQMNPGNVTLRPNNPNMNQIRPQQMQSPFPAPQAPSPSQPQPSPMGMRAVPSPIQNSAPSPISQPQQFIQQQQINQISQQHQQQQQQLTPMNSQGSNAMNMPVNSTVPTMRTRIWSGIIEYYDKQPPTMNKMMYHLECQITYQHNNNEPEFSSQGWPEKMLINTVPKLLINRLSPIFKNNSYHVNLHFNNDSPGLQKLLKAMSANSVGCIQLPNPANIRIIIILYMPDKKMFVGFIPHNQDEFMTSMKELIESHKKEQAVKQQQQKMLSHMQMANAMGHQQQMQQQQQQGQVAVNQAPNAQPQLAPMGGPLSIQLSHGQMAQAGQSGAGQIMPPNSANTMFQLQQMNNNQSLGSNQNANIGGGSAGPGPSAQVPMSQASTTGASPGGGMLLNQTLSGISNANQPKNSVFIGNTSANGNQMTATTTNGGAGMQITLNSTANNGGQMQQANLPPLGQQQQQQKQIMQQNVPTHQVSGQQQQFNMMANSQQQQLNMRPSAGGGGAGAAAGFGQNANEREQNLMAIKQLEQTLKEAQKKEMEYQLQHSQQDPPKPGQMIASASLQQQPQQNNAVRQHLQHQLQQKQQMIHMQQQQQQQQQQQHQVNINSNLQQQQLRHLLQQQQLRSINPSARMQGTVSHQQPQQSQIMLQQQGGPMAQQQQQFRFQAQQQPAQQATAQQHGRNFFDEY